MSAMDYRDEDFEDEGFEEQENVAAALQGLSLQERRQLEAQIGAARGQQMGKNYTFNHNRLEAIGRENEVLLTKLQKIAVKGSNATGAKGSTQPAARRASSQEINRRRKQQEIARQNLMIADRLQNAKSATFDKKKMREDQILQEKYMRNAAHYPVAPRDAPKLKTKPSAPGRPPWYKELPKVTKITGRPEWKD
eukprot:CAMPEP_0184293082 /NCGR_PEP_ID=MMETSP1049-20130417/4661_1 /TAXON_ID=77928 /ORGANISM="Proteomonas sulcata, Strain CCMP704" /LENGTH=193 /DNA_ID=CAMNT_0026601013 /DNA_START=29 /DNA_END=610 /DNA_ORIENTATION=-